MFSRLSTAFVYVLVAFTVFAAAIPGGGGPPTTTTVTVTAPAPPGQTIPASSCSADGGTVLCCDTVEAANADPLIGIILGLLEIVLPDLSVVIGLTCTIFSGTCTAQTVCCEDNDFQGIVAVGCSPVNISLKK